MVFTEILNISTIFKGKVILNAYYHELISAVLHSFKLQGMHYG